SGPWSVGTDFAPLILPHGLSGDGPWHDQIAAIIDGLSAPSPIRPTGDRSGFAGCFHFAIRPVRLPDMEDQGENRVTCTPRRTLPLVRKASRGSRLNEVPIFEPYRESLPLQSGFYTYLIDQDGNFRVRRTNTQSHSSMVPGGRAAAAGRFEVNRLGRV